MKLFFRTLMTHIAIGSLVSSADAILVDDLAPFRTKRMAKDAPKIPAGTYAEAESGEYISGLEGVDGFRGEGWGVAIYDIPIEFVWKAVNDEGTFANRHR